MGKPRYGSMLNRKKEAAIGALLTHRTIEDAATAIGISSKTLRLRRWLKRSEFQTAHQQARRESLSQCMARLQQASSAAVSTLLKVMVHPSAPPGSRVRAADSVLTHATQGGTLWQLEEQAAAMGSATANPNDYLEEICEAANRGARLLGNTLEMSATGPIEEIDPAPDSPPDSP